jgi:hypothetical protein
MKKLVLTYGLLLSFLISFSQLDERKGLFDRVDLIQTKWYAPNYARYNPNPALMKKLIALYDPNVKIDIVFGFWCSDSEIQVPAFLRVVDSLQVIGKEFTQNLIATDKSKTYGSNQKVEYVPTFIFSKFGQEVGRIVETPQKSMEKDIIAILKKAAKIKPVIQGTPSF